MIVFEDNELEVAIVTYNRAAFIREWVENCYQGFADRNIGLSIYDSSSNDETYEYISGFNGSLKSNTIQYHRVNSDVEIGYKPMLPLTESSAKYVWVAGDSTRFSFEELDAKVFPMIKKNIDYILICTVFNYENDGTIYENDGNFLRDCFISMTCIGLSIYKRSIFDNLFTDKGKLDYCENHYRHNYGFGWLGYFLWAFSMGNYKASFHVLGIIPILPQQKKQQWAKRFYGCWVEDLIQLIDSLPEKYENKYLVPAETWERMQLASHFYCHRARISGGLTPEDFEKYNGNGMLSRVTDNIELIHFYTYAPEWKTEMVFHYTCEI